MPADDPILVARLFEAVGSESFYPRLADYLRSGADFDDIVILRYRAAGPPKAKYAVLGEPDPGAYTSFVQGLYQQSPFYELTQKKETTFSTLRDIAPDDFWESEYYHSCMGPARLVDEASFTMYSPDGIAYLVTVGRTDALELYTDAEKSALAKLAPVVQQSVLRHEQLMRAEPSALTNSAADVVNALPEMPHESLTDREREIVGYLIRGYSSKACARELDISPATERVHRKNIYEKLGVSSQAELLANVFESLLRLAANKEE